MLSSLERCSPSECAGQSQLCNQAKMQFKLSSLYRCYAGFTQVLYRCYTGVMQVFGKMLQVITAVTVGCTMVGKREAASAVGGFVERIADSKLRSPACAALTALSEAVGPQFIATQLHNKATAQKSPKACCIP